MHSELLLNKQKLIFVIKSSITVCLSFCLHLPLTSDRDSFVCHFSGQIAKKCVKLTNVYIYFV